VRGPQKLGFSQAFRTILAASDADFEQIFEMLLDRAVDCSTTTASPAVAMPSGQNSLVKRRRLDKDLSPSAAQR